MVNHRNREMKIWIVSEHILLDLTKSSAETITNRNNFSFFSFDNSGLKYSFQKQENKA